MKVKLIFPSWEKLPFQTPFDLAPLGLSTFAGLLPKDWEITLVDENLRPVDLDDSPDLVGISMLLTAQAKRGYEIGDAYRRRGIPVIMGGIHTNLMPEEAAEHADTVVACEVEAVAEDLLADMEKGTLKPIYNAETFPALDRVPRARRDLLDRARYAVKGVQMFDLVQATRGCTYSCYPCCVPKLRGTDHRVRPVADVIAEIRDLPNDRVFIVDNCLMQNKPYQRELFAALADLCITWVAHPISDDDDILDLARKSGAWYVYQAIDRVHDTIRERVKKYHDHGIAVEGTILLGRDSHDKDFFRRMMDFLFEIEVEIVEFTILTPFPNLPLFRKFERDGRILHKDWSRYNTANSVFQPKLMTPAELEEGYRWSWETFYEEHSQEARMASLHLRAMADHRARQAAG